MPDNAAADRWYRRYLELQEERKAAERSPARAGRDDVSQALREQERRLRAMDVVVYQPRRGMSPAARRALLQKRTAQLEQAYQREAQRVVRDLERTGAPFAIGVRELASRTGLPEAEAQAVLERIWFQRAGAAKRRLDEQALEAFARALSEEQRDSRKPDGTGRRPQPGIAKVPVVTFTGSDVVGRKDGIHVQDIDGTDIYVTVDAVRQQVVKGKVPGFAALTPEEADSLHLVLVEAEHYQRGLLRQAVLEGNHDPADVLAMSRAETARTAYRKRLGLPAHNYSEACCGAELGAPAEAKEVTA